MDIEALIKNLQALSDTLKSTAIREGESLNDFKMSFQKKDLPTHDEKELSEILTEIGNYSNQQIDILQFVSEIAPKK